MTDSNFLTVNISLSSSRQLLTYLPQFDLKDFGSFFFFFSCCWLVVMEAMPGKNSEVWN